MSTQVHDFATSLRRSEAQVDAGWWEVVYRKAFPTMKEMVSISEDGWAQRGGIDRLIVLTSGKVITVDEKVRLKDFNDVLLEYWSDTERRTPGWIAKDLACDFIAYAYLETQRCFLLPFHLLRRAWKQNGREWVSRAERKEEGFKKVVAQNRGYTTTSVAISWNVLSEALIDSAVIYFSPETIGFPEAEIIPTNSNPVPEVVNVS